MSGSDCDFNKRDFSIKGFHAFFPFCYLDVFSMINFYSHELKILETASVMYLNQCMEQNLLDDMDIPVTQKQIELSLSNY